MLLEFPELLLEFPGLLIAHSSLCCFKLATYFARAFLSAIQSWDEILRLASSIRTGTVTASLMLRKLASYPRQNRLALALRELGRIERTLFTLSWLQSPELRQRATAGLNKGEAKHTLKRAVFFNRLGELRDRSYEDQFYWVSGLNLVIAAIVLWNTVYLEKAVDYLQKQGMDIPEEYLQHLSPLGWEHINLTGDYVWNFCCRRPVLTSCVLCGLRKISIAEMLI